MNPGWPLVVRRRDIQDATPIGGDFRRSSIVPLPIPPVLSGNLGVFCVDTTERLVALTYDDGPHPVFTPQVLDALRENGSTATFFVLGEQAERHPDIVRRIVAEGHEIALHGWDHRSLLTMSPAEAMSSVRRARRVVESIAGVRIRNFRPPYGRASLAQMARLRMRGLDIVMWSSDPYDYLDHDVQTIAERAVAGVFPGGIVLLHDNRGDLDTLAPGEVVPRFDRGALATALLGWLDEHGYRTSTVQDLLTRHRQVRSAAREEMGYR